MNAVSTIEAADIVLAVEATPQIVLLDAEKFDEFYDRIKAETTGIVEDLSTKKGRDAVIARAAKVTKSKTLIDKARLQLTGEWRERTNQVNAAGKEIETRLTALAKEVRQPVTDWEIAEKERLDRCNEVISDIHGAAIVTLEDTSETVRLRGMRIWAIEIGEDFGSLQPEAEQAKSATISTLQAALARLKREEAERAELEKLRAEAAERQAREDAERAEREAKERAEAEAALAEERRIASEKADQERNERIAREAEERAKRAAEQAAQAERERIQREHDQALAAERRRAEEAEQAIQAERERAAKEEADRIAAQKAEAAEQAKRDKNRAHRAQIMGEAKIAIMATAPGLDDATAVLIVKAIVAGKVPHTTLRF
jgi:colicin import membrane protein